MRRFPWSSERQIDAAQAASLPPGLKARLVARASTNYLTMLTKALSMSLSYVAKPSAAPGGLLIRSGLLASEMAVSSQSFDEDDVTSSGRPAAPSRLAQTRQDISKELPSG